MRDAVVRAIAAAAAAGELPTGAALPNDKILSVTHGASRTVIREAIQHLATRNVLEVRAGSGTYIRPLTDWDLQDSLLVETLEAADALGPMLPDLFDMRRMLEGEAAALAAVRATPADIAVNYRLLGELAAHADQSEAYIAAHGAFHRHILDMSKNRLLMSFAAQVDAVQSVILRRYFRHLFADRPRAVAARPEDNAHYLLHAAIAEHRPEAARAAMLAHLQPMERVALALFAA